MVEEVTDHVGGKGWAWQRLDFYPGGTVLKAERGNEAVQVYPYTRELTFGYWIRERFCAGSNVTYVIKVTTNSSSC